VTRAQAKLAASNLACIRRIMLALVGYPHYPGAHSWCDIRTLLGHRDPATTQIYTHVLNQGPAGTRSPNDSMDL
jgi:integrase